MAIIIRGRTKCSLCGDVLAEGEDLVLTSHFIADHTDPLWGYSDSGMHRQCFMGWKRRLAFVDRFNQIVGQQVFGNGMRHRMDLDGTIHVERVEPTTDGAR